MRPSRPRAAFRKPTWSRSTKSTFPVAADGADRSGWRSGEGRDRSGDGDDRRGLGSATSYTESLAGATEQLGQSKDREGVRAIIESLVQTTRTMEISNRQLEERL